VLGTSLSENNPVHVPRTPPGKGGMAPASEADLGTLARPVGQDREPRGGGGVGGGSSGHCQV
jgi:hypothetical protein